MALENGAYSLEEKREAVVYFNNNGVPKQIEQLLNKIFKEKPSDIFGYMVSASEILGSQGFPSFEVNFHCTINGLCKHVASIVSPLDTSPSPESLPTKAKTPDSKSKTPDQPKQQKAADAVTANSTGDSEIGAKEDDIDEMIQRIDTIIGPLMVGFDPTNQNGVDESLQKLEEQEKLKKSESIPDQTDEGVDTLKSEDNHDDTKKSTVSKGDVKHVTQDTSKKTDSKKQGTSSNKGTQPQATPDLEEEKVCRDYTMVTVSMGIALTDAYFLIPIHADHYKYLRFEWNSTLFEFICLPFGLSLAPRAFAKVLKPFVASIRNKGIRLVIYLDDMAIISSSRELSSQEAGIVVQILESLGFIINKEKSVLFPSQKIVFLGYVIDSVARTVSLPEEKLNKVKEQTLSLSRKPQCSIRELAHVI
ncbi:Gag-Pol polyprotein [Acropora cervicornis]|uniref:Gag-Pol polyprotein n=1 Tax=Acropora cervicornis TaxID=6130 RepID=A0AAD9VF16_ACRCE|nr:Gag-Pol polyprotein [Acropora cervicornis]